jgi:aspartate/methionine/tyrosine aminotransferase
MDIDAFELERWFARHEPDADVMLAESGVRSLPASRFDLDPGRLGYVIPTDGAPALRAEVAARYGREADEAVFTCGTQEANLLATLGLLSAGDHAVVVTPTYQSLHALPDAVADVTRVALDPPDWTLAPDAVADAMRPETALVVVNNPNNPTGRVHPTETVEAVYDLAADRGAYLLCDEVYRPLVADPAPPAASLGPYGVSTCGLSKGYGLAGLRFGWLVGPPEVASAARHWKDYITISPPAVGHHVARQVLGEGDDRGGVDEAALLAEHRSLAADHRALVAEFLSEYGLSWYDPEGVNGFPTVPDGFASGRSFCERLVREESVVLAPGDAFGHPDRFRIGFGCEREVLEEGLSRVGAFLDRHA